MRQTSAGGEEMTHLRAQVTDVLLVLSPFLFEVVDRLLQHLDFFFPGVLNLGAEICLARIQIGRFGRDNLLERLDLRPRVVSLLR